jgi:hypothetical protein
MSLLLGLGGILVGVKAQVIEVISWQMYNFCDVVIVKKISMMSLFGGL